MRSLGTRDGCGDRENVSLIVWCTDVQLFPFQARKFLPYGFGPGSRTVIEDAASFDDDEEDYGEYQVRCLSQPTNR